MLARCGSGDPPSGGLNNGSIANLLITILEPLIQQLIITECAHSRVDKCPEKKAA